MGQIKAILNKIRNKAPSWGLAFLARRTFITAVYTIAIITPLFSANFYNWMNWLAFRATTNEASIFIFLVSFIVAIPMYFLYATHIFHNESLNACEAGR